MRLPTALLFLKSLPPLGIGITVSLTLHGALLVTHFVVPNVAEMARDKGLDIVLVNARSRFKPTDAQVLAQANLDGGGDTAEDRRAKTPLPPSQHRVSGDEVMTQKKRASELELQQQQLLTQIRGVRPQALAQTGQTPSDPQPAKSGFDLVESARAMARLEGEISKSVDEYNKRPRKKEVGLRAKESELAFYLDAFARKIERLGTLNYPEAAKGKFYGSVMLYIELNLDDGSLREYEIRKSSGNKLIDNAAVKILKMASPFGPIPKGAMEGYAVLIFARQINFVHGDTVQAQ
mgnify:CR=1 FL=1